VPPRAVAVAAAGRDAVRLLRRRASTVRQRHVVTVEERPEGVVGGQARVQPRERLLVGGLEVTMDDAVEVDVGEVRLETAEGGRTEEDKADKTAFEHVGGAVAERHGEPAKVGRSSSSSTLAGEHRHRDAMATIKKMRFPV